MTRFIASMLFKDQEEAVQPYLIRYNSGDTPQEESFEQVKKCIEETDHVSYVAGRPIPCYSDKRYVEAYKNIDKDYTFVFREPKPNRDPNQFKKSIFKPKKGS